MLIHKSDTFIVEIPKTGTKTVRRIVDQISNGSSLHGHFSISEAINKNEGNRFSEIIAVIRNPEDRLLSAVNFCMSLKDVDASTLLKGALNGYAKQNNMAEYYSFKPQYKFLDTADRVTIFRFEELHRLATHLGFSKPLPHVNKSKPLIEKSQLKKFSAYRDVMALYEKDMDLYESYSIFEM